MCLGDMGQGRMICPEVCSLKEEVLGADGDVVTGSSFSNNRLECSRQVSVLGLNPPVNISKEIIRTIVVWQSQNDAVCCERINMLFLQSSLLPCQLAIKLAEGSASQQSMWGAWIRPDSVLG